MDKLRLIQCGVGGHGGSWVRDTTTQSPDFDLAAVVDVAPANIEASQQYHNLPAECCFSSLEDALQAVEADAVLTVTPPPVHIQHARLAFGHGLHLITEKPLADTVENAQEMVRLAREAGKQLVVSQNYRYSPPMQKLKALLGEKAVGDFGHGDLDFYIPADFSGTFREKMEHVLLVDMAIHHMDLIRAVTGLDIVSVTAKSFRPAWSWYEGESALKMLLELEGGLPFTYSGDWSGKGRNTSWNGNWRLQCVEGSLHLENDRAFIGRSERWGANQTIEDIEIPELEPGSQQMLLHLFAEAIRTGIPAPTCGEDNLKSFAAVMAGVKSAAENRTVEIAELLNG